MISRTTRPARDAANDTERWTAIDSYRRDAINTGEWLTRARIVDEPRKRDLRYIVLGVLAALCWVAIFVIARAW